MMRSPQILTNLSCNLDCAYCYEHKDGRVNDFESIKAFIDKYPAETYELVGGESFLVIDLVEKITDYVRAKGARQITISSNGTLLSDERVRAYIEKNKDLLSLGISIDGTREVHNKNRSGSYDDIVRNLPWLFSVLCKKKIGCKATFTKETFRHFYESIVNLIKLGFVDIAGNIVYEDHVGLEEAPMVFDQLVMVVDYLINNDLIRDISVRPLMFKVGEIAQYNYQMLTGFGKEAHNFCGSCNEMICIGFDNKEYGCNRFCTMPDPLEIDQVKEDVMLQHALWPDECQRCKLKSMCPACAAFPYEQGCRTRDEVRRFLHKKGMCGWTYGVAIARSYMSAKYNIRYRRKGG